MRQIIFIIALVGAIASFAFTGFNTSRYAPLASKVVAQDSVYICDSKTAYAYHKSQFCSGLSHCTHGVFKVSLKDAETVYGRRACKVCY